MTEKSVPAEISSSDGSQTNSLTPDELKLAMYLALMQQQHLPRQQRPLSTQQGTQVVCNLLNAYPCASPDVCR